MNQFPTKLIFRVAIALVSIFLLYNLIGYNSAGCRVHRISIFGDASVIFKPGFYIDGFSKTVTYNDIMTLAFSKESTNSSMDVPPIQVRFNDGSVADATGVIKFVLPKDEASMIKLHNDYRSPENLAATALKQFGVECLKNSAQLMSSEMHYLGGRSTMSQYFQDQLESGVYILKTSEQVIRDTIQNENTRNYVTEILKDKNNNPIRKKSVLIMYGISISDASISDVDYEPRIDEKLAQKIDATTKTSVSKQKLILAQQDALTAEATGKKTLVDIEYQEKQNQTKQVIQAQTQVELAKQNLDKQNIDFKTAQIEAQTIKTLADAEAYKKKTVMLADGALEQKLKTYVTVQTVWATAFENYKGNIVPTYMMGSGGNMNAMQTFMDLQNARNMRDLSLDLNTK